MKLEPQGAAQGTIRNINDDLLLNLLEDRELSLLQNAVHLLVSIFLVYFQFVILNLHCLPFLPHGWAAGRHELYHAGFVPWLLQAGCLRHCRKECLYLNDIFCFSLHCWIFFN